VTALALDYTYRYLHPSRWDPPSRTLQLATFSEEEDGHPYFFTGRLVRPEQTAKMLRSLMRVVQTRFHVPPAMLGRILAMADPVVTSSDDRLRLERLRVLEGLASRARSLRVYADDATGASGWELVFDDSRFHLALCDTPKSMPRDYGKLLELLRELSIDLAQPVTEEPCRAFLGQIQGSGKAAKTAKALLALTPENAAQSGQRLMQQALAARLAAAGRYADRQRGG